MNFDDMFKEIADAMEMNPWDEWVQGVALAYESLSNTEMPQHLVEDITVVVAENSLGIIRDTYKGQH